MVAYNSNLCKLLVILWERRAKIYSYRPLGPPFPFPQASDKRIKYRWIIHKPQRPKSFLPSRAFYWAYYISYLLRHVLFLAFRIEYTSNVTPARKSKANLSLKEGQVLAWLVFCTVLEPKGSIAVILIQKMPWNFLDIFKTRCSKYSFSSPKTCIVAYVRSTEKDHIEHPSPNPLHTHLHPRQSLYFWFLFLPCSFSSNQVINAIKEPTWS